jgi:hypothetical protein
VDNPRAVAHLASRFAALRTSLAVRIAAKRAYIVARGVEPAFALDARCLDAVADDIRAAPNRRTESAIAAPSPRVPFEHSAKPG